MSGHPAFGAQIIRNGHEYVARGAQKAGIELRKEGNCFVYTRNGAGLAQIADTLSEPQTEGRLRQLCNRWIYSTCLIFGLDLKEQERSGFQYQYASYQLEYSRNLRFYSGQKMWHGLQGLIDRNRGKLNLKVGKTIFGFKDRPRVKRLKENRWGVEVETPTYVEDPRNGSAERAYRVPGRGTRVPRTTLRDLTVFHVHYGKLSLQIPDLRVRSGYSKGACVLRIEVMVHNMDDAPFRRGLVDFPKTVAWMREVLERFLNTLQCMRNPKGRTSGHAIRAFRGPVPGVFDARGTRVSRTVDACCIADETLERLPEPSVVGKTRVGGVDTNRLRMKAVVVLSTSPKGFTAGEVACKVRSLGGLPESAYSPRQAAYDLKKLRGKQMVPRKPRSRRYEELPDGLRAMAALVVLRDDVIKPLLAGQGNLRRGRRPSKSAPIDAHYAVLQHDMRERFRDLGMAA